MKKAAASMIGAAFFFACMGATVKLASSSLTNETIVFFRNVTGLIALFPWLCRHGIPRLRKRQWHLYAVRSGFGLGAMYCFFYAIAHMRLAEAVLLNYTMPLFVPFIAGPWLGERLHRGIWLGLGLGFVGVSLILKPGLGLLDPVALVGLGAGVLAAVAQVSIRRLTREDSTVGIVFYFGFFGTLFSVVPLLFGWSTPGPQTWLILALMGGFATIAQLFLTTAYAHAPAASVGPFIYTIVIFAALLDWGVWHRLPDSLSIVGAVFICLGGVLTTRKIG
ncbi:MAG: DMT family transporter [Acidobacteria bacterium]|nr:MAG: DMT family transporter [Acidobacteriota bacterium]